MYQVNASREGLLTATTDVVSAIAKVTSESGNKLEGDGCSFNLHLAASIGRITSCKPRRFQTFGPIQDLHQ